MAVDFNTRIEKCISDTINQIGEFLKPLNLRVKHIENYNSWNNNWVGVYKYRSSASGVLRIGVNKEKIINFAKEEGESAALEQIEITLWHEAGHGLIEHIRRMRRLDTQAGTKIFRGKMLQDLRDLYYDEEETVEDFGEDMAGIFPVPVGNLLTDFIEKYKDKLVYKAKIMEHKVIKLNEEKIRQIVSETVRNILKESKYNYKNGYNKLRAMAHIQAKQTGEDPQVVFDRLLNNAKAKAAAFNDINRDISKRRDKEALSPDDKEFYGRVNNDIFNIDDEDNGLFGDNMGNPDSGIFSDDVYNDGDSDLYYRG